MVSGGGGMDDKETSAFEELLGRDVKFEGLDTDQWTWFTKSWIKVRNQTDLKRDVSLTIIANQGQNRY
jgi:hypothetical protein